MASVSNRAEWTMPGDDAVLHAAARVVYYAGRFHRWQGLDKPYDMLGPIERDEFEGIIRRALEAADAARRRARSVDRD
jgi:hypothetical protein